MGASQWLRSNWHSRQTTAGSELVLFGHPSFGMLRSTCPCVHCFARGDEDCGEVGLETSVVEQSAMSPEIIAWGNLANKVPIGLGVTSL